MIRLMLCATTAAALGVTGCKAQTPSAQQAATTSASVAAAAAAPASAWAPAPADKAGFDVTVTLSSAATQKLTAAHEGIVVSAMFFAEVNAEGRKHHLGDESGEIGFGAEKHNEIPAAGTTHFVIPAPDPEKIKYVDGAKEQVLINVYTARHTSQDNLIDCGIFQDDVRIAARDGIKIACKLIGEGGT